MKILKTTFAMVVMLCCMTSCTVMQSMDATGNPVGSKVGVAKSKPFGSSEFGIKDAAKNGGITKIATVDVSLKFILIFPIYKTTVTGE